MPSLRASSFWADTDAAQRHARRPARLVTQYQDQFKEPLPTMIEDQHEDQHEGARLVTQREDQFKEPLPRGSARVYPWSGLHGAPQPGVTEIPTIRAFSSFSQRVGTAASKE